VTRPIATVRIMPLPDGARGAVRVEVACPEGTTGMTQVPAPGGVELPVATLITATVFGHEERCGACDTADAHRREARRRRHFVPAHELRRLKVQKANRNRRRRGRGSE